MPFQPKNLLNQTKKTHPTTLHFTKPQKKKNLLAVLPTELETIFGLRCALAPGNSLTSPPYSNSSFQSGSTSAVTSPLWNQLVSNRDDDGGGIYESTRAGKSVPFDGSRATKMARLAPQLRAMITHREFAVALFVDYCWR